MAMACPSEAYRLAVLPSIVQRYGRGRALIFTDTKRDADALAQKLSGNFPTVALHGDIAQDMRERALSGFRKGQYQCLVATDVAARGIDIPHVPLVVQFRPPKSSETYIHRSGRTGRAGKEGTAVLMYGGRSEAHAPAKLTRDAGCTFTFVGDLAHAEGGASLVADTVHDKLCRGVPEASPEALASVVEELCAVRGWTQDELLAAAVYEISKAARGVPLPSLLTGEKDLCTLQVTVPRQRDDAGGNLISFVKNATGVKPVGQVTEVRNKKEGTQYLFDVPRSAVEDVLAQSSDDESSLTIVRAEKIPDQQRKSNQHVSLMCLCVNAYTSLCFWPLTMSLAGGKSGGSRGSRGARGSRSGRGGGGSGKGWNGNTHINFI